MSSGVVFQLSLDQSDLSEAMAMAEVGVAAGINVIEAGTILILAEGARNVLPALRTAYPNHPIVADVKCTDGVGPEFGVMFGYGANKATVMASASDASIRNAVAEAAKYPGCEVMVDTMGCSGQAGTDILAQVTASKRAHDLGAHYVVLHLGYDERNANRAMVDDNLLLKWAEAVAKANIGIPIQVVGGLTMAQAKVLPTFGINEIVISMNLGTTSVTAMDYDKITGFTVDLNDAGDRARVQSQISEFIKEVNGASA